MILINGVLFNAAADFLAETGIRDPLQSRVLRAGAVAQPVSGELIRGPILRQIAPRKGDACGLANGYFAPPGGM